MTEPGKTVQFLNEKFGDAVLGVETQFDFQVVTIRPDVILPLLTALYQHPELQYQYLTTLCGIHYPDQNKLAVMYQLHSLINNLRIRLKIYLPEDDPKTSSITTIFKAANWMEREAYDFFGIQFEGHPDLRRILNVEEMVFFPMRKEFPMEDQVRGDKPDQMFGR